MAGSNPTRSGATPGSRLCSTAIPTAKFGERTRGTRSAAAASRSRWWASCPVVPTTSGIPRSAARAANSTSAAGVANDRGTQHAVKAAGASSGPPSRTSLPPSPASRTVRPRRVFSVRTNAAPRENGSRMHSRTARPIRPSAPTSPSLIVRKPLPTPRISQPLGHRHVERRLDLREEFRTLLVGAPEGTEHHVQGGGREAPHGRTATPRGDAQDVHDRLHGDGIPRADPDLALRGPLLGLAGHG